MQPGSLPEGAQLGGNSFLLHSDDVGSTYLYVEQQQGARLSVFDVTDPGHVKTVVSTPLTVTGPFGFVRPLDGRAELIRFRDGKTVGVLDLAKAKKPSIRIVSALMDPGKLNLSARQAFWALTNHTTTSVQYLGTIRSSISQHPQTRPCSRP